MKRLFPKVKGCDAQEASLEQDGRWTEVSRNDDLSVKLGGGSMVMWA